MSLLEVSLIEKRAIPHFSLFLLWIKQKHVPGLSLFSPDSFQRKELHQKLSQHDLLLEQLGEKQRSLQVPKRFGKIAGVNDF